MEPANDVDGRRSSSASEALNGRSDQACASVTGPLIQRLDGSMTGGPEQIAPSLENRATEFVEKSTASRMSSVAPARETHPWGKWKPVQKRRWSRQCKDVLPLREESRGIPAAKRDGAPMLAALCGYEPDAARLREEGRR